MYELLDSTIKFISDFLFWPFLIFVGFCITDALLPEKKKKPEDYE